MAKLIDKIKCSEFIDSTENLINRFNINIQYGDNDLQSWVTKNLEAKEGERVLDIGCGDGTHLRSVASIVKKDNHCIGIDYDLGMVDKAITQSENFVPLVSFLQMDMDNIGSPNSPFKGNSLDLIYSVYAFYYSQNEFKLLDVLKNKLKPEGRITVVGPHVGNNREWFDFLNQFMQIPKPVLVSTTTFMEGIRNYAEKSFREVKTLDFVNNITIPSLDILRKYWVSNIYYDPTHDSDFEEYARQHFEREKTFRFPKKAELITMGAKNN